MVVVPDVGDIDVGIGAYRRPCCQGRFALEVVGVEGRVVVGEYLCRTRFCHIRIVGVRLILHQRALQLGGNLDLVSLVLCDCFLDGLDAVRFIIRTCIAEGQGDDMISDALRGSPHLIGRGAGEQHHQHQQCPYIEYFLVHFRRLYMRLYVMIYLPKHHVLSAIMVLLVCWAGFSPHHCSVYFCVSTCMLVALTVTL